MSPESRIRAIIAEQTDAWNAGDGHAYSAHFSSEGSFVNIVGLSYVGRAAFEERHTNIFATIFKGSQLETEVRRIRLVAPTVAVVEVDCTVRGVRQAPPGVALHSNGTLRTRALQLFVERDGDWWVEVYHNVDVKHSLKRIDE
jgi:uncharacterized protein (TIGR02246 family)